MIFSFAFFLALGLYPYFVYPMVAKLISLLTRHTIRKSFEHVPYVTLLIAAHNEAAVIEATVLNKLDQDYPQSQLDVIVVSDGSTDGTDEIVASLSAKNSRVKLIRQELRSGKTSALNCGFAQATGKIIVFSDANSQYAKDTIRQLVACFSDERVGYVTGKMTYTDPRGSAVSDGCSAYMRFENWLREVETKLGSIVGADGGVDAIRRELYEPMRVDQLPDFVLPLSVTERGYRVVYEPNAILLEESLDAVDSEFRMRVRVALRALWAMRDKVGLLLGSAGLLFAFQLWSHKALRYFSFVPLAVAFIISISLAVSRPLFTVVVALEVLALMLAIGALKSSRLSSVLPFRLCGYFLLLNIASAVAAVRFLKGKKQILWKPREG